MKNIFENGLSNQEKKDLAIIRSAKSGEMHNMFVVCRKYEITPEQWYNRYEEIRKDDLYLQKLRSIADKQLNLYND